MTITDTERDLEHDGTTHVAVVADRCAGCQECVIRCPVGALSMDPATWTAVADDAVCVGCRQCVRTCPFSAISVQGPVRVTERLDPALHHPAVLEGNVDETRVGFASWEDARREAERCLTCLDPTCVRGCPAHNDIPGFIGALRDGDLTRAHEVLARTTVLPDVCSRVCNQSAQCEGACTWSLAGEAPVSIGRLERFITEHEPVPAPVVGDEATDLSVAVVGSGPAGAAVAWDLVRAGAAVTVFERDETPGGLPLWGMPDFTLPDEVARRPWRQLIEAGVEVRCGVEVGAQELTRLLAEHDAVVMAHGAGVPMRLPVPGADLAGVVDATSFLQGAKHALEPGGDADALRAALGLATVESRRPSVLVLGAGNTAMDVARMARRLGLDATCVDWLDERFALARPDELAEARAEGVTVRFQRTVTALRGEGRVASAELAVTSQKDAAHPPVVSSERETLPVDLVVMAMGYRLDPSFAPALPGTPVRKTVAPIPDRHWVASGILANPASAYAHNSPVGSLALGREVGLWSAALPVTDRLWVVGDALTGPATVVEAMAQGRRAAAAILDARPARPGRDSVGEGARSPRVLVCVESEGGTTRRAAEAIAQRFWRRGVDATVAALDEVGLPELAAADLLVVGSWVEGLVVTKVRPARATRAWLAALPRLGGRPVALFCTYGVNPRGALDEMRAALEAKGAVVIDQAAFGPRERRRDDDPAGPDAFGARLVAHALRQTAVRTVSR